MYTATACARRFEHWIKNFPEHFLNAHYVHVSGDYWDPRTLSYNTDKGRVYLQCGYSCAFANLSWWRLLFHRFHMTGIDWNSSPNSQPRSKDQINNIRLHAYTEWTISPSKNETKGTQCLIQITGLYIQIQLQGLPYQVHIIDIIQYEQTSYIPRGNVRYLLIMKPSNIK